MHDHVQQQQVVCKDEQVRLHLGTSSFCFCQICVCLPVCCSANAARQDVAPRSSVTVPSLPQGGQAPACPLLLLLSRSCLPVFVPVLAARRHRMSDDMAKTLVKSGAPLDAGDGKGNTALHYALEMDDLHVSVMLGQACWGSAVCCC